MDTVIIDGVEYVAKDSVAKDSVAKLAKNIDGMRYVIVRTYSAGVFAGYLQKQDKKEVTMLNARRLWYWEGAASLSQLAMSGVTKPDACKFPCEMSSIELTEAVEIIDCTEKARLNIKAVPVWSL